MLVGGYLAAMPAYQPDGASANLTLQFDGYFNYLAGVYIHPQPTETRPLNQMIVGWVTQANDRSAQYGNGFGFRANRISELSSVTQSYEDYKEIKSYITDRCDNKSGAGEFEFYVSPERQYSIIPDSEFGQDRSKDYTIQYPAQINVVSATQFSAPEVNGFASVVIGVGDGETSGDESQNTAITSIQVDEEAVKEYGYAETVLSQSSVSVQASLDANTAAELRNRSSMKWMPEIELSGRQIHPYPNPILNDPTSDGPEDRESGPAIWIGDRIAIQNNADLTGMTSGVYRVEALEVSVDGSGAESIKPSMVQDGAALNAYSFAQEFVRIRRELLALRSVKRRGVI